KTARPRSPAIRIQRRRQRSTQTPAGSVMSRKGRNTTVSSAATWNGLASSVRTATVGIASWETCEPNSLIVWPVQSLRKSRCDQRAPPGLRIGGGGAGERTRFEHAALEVGRGRRRRVDRLGHLPDGAERREEHPEEGRR